MIKTRQILEAMAMKTRNRIIFLVFAGGLVLLYTGGGWPDADRCLSFVQGTSRIL